MSPRIVVVGAGYAGAGAIRSLEEHFDPGEAEIHWLSETDYHLVLHEAHRAIRDPGVRESITIPVEDIKREATTFEQGTVVGLDTAERELALADGPTVEYDYAVIAIGSATAFYGIPGLREHAHTMKSLDDATAIHEDLEGCIEEAGPADPIQVVVGGAGLSGIQVAGEVAAYRENINTPVEITLVEALPEIYPAGGSRLRQRLRRELGAAGVTVRTDDPITAVDENGVQFDRGDPLSYDVFVWTGGIKGREGMTETGLATDHGRLHADATFQTENDRVFALGDAAVIAQADDEAAPPTAQAAWKAAEHLGENVRRTVDGEALEPWSYEGQGTLISIGETALAADVPGVPMEVFDSLPATILKKGAAARWIATLTSWPRAFRAWGDL